METVSDGVGSKVLCMVLTERDSLGCAADGGPASGFYLTTTAMPFILREVDSVMYPVEKRKIARLRIFRLKFWNQLIRRQFSLLIELRRRDIVAGKVRGRLPVDLNQ